MVALYGLLILPFASCLYYSYLGVVVRAVRFVAESIDWQSDDLRWKLGDDEGKIE